MSEDNTQLNGLESLLREGRWTHEPVAAAFQGGRLTVTAEEGSDAWRHTAYGFVHDSEHGLLAPMPAEGAVEVSFILDYTEQFDQAGLLLRVRHGVDQGGSRGVRRGAPGRRGGHSWHLRLVSGTRPRLGGARGQHQSQPQRGRRHHPGPSRGRGLAPRPRGPPRPRGTGAGWPVLRRTDPSGPGGDLHRLPHRRAGHVLALSPHPGTDGRCQIGARLRIWHLGDSVVCRPVAGGGGARCAGRAPPPPPDGRKLPGRRPGRGQGFVDPGNTPSERGSAMPDRSSARNQTAGATACGRYRSRTRQDRMRRAFSRRVAPEAGRAGARLGMG